MGNFGKIIDMVNRLEEVYNKSNLAKAAVKNKSKIWKKYG